MLEMFKMFIGVSFVRFDSIFKLSTNRNTRGHTLKVAKHRSWLHLRKYFFSERVISRWNSLEQNCIQKTTINGFKQSLKERQKERERLLHGLISLPSLKVTSVSALDTSEGCFHCRFRGDRSGKLPGKFISNRSRPISLLLLYLCAFLHLNWVLYQ